MKNSPQKKQLQNSIQAILDLYHHEELLKPENEWSWEKLEKPIKKIFLSIFDECRFDQKNRSIILSTNFSENKFKTIETSHVSISSDDLCSFIEIMDELQHATMKNIDTHCMPTLIKNETFTMFSEPNGTDFEKIKEINHQISDYHKQKDGISINSRRHSLFEISILSDFAKKLIYTEPINERPIDIPAINFPSWTSFIQIVRSIFVNYHIEFGDFSRIKICNYCETLYYELRKGQKKFCSPNCRSSYAHSMDADGRLKCRQRQNKFINYYADKFGQAEDSLTAFLISKDDCEDCGQIASEKYVKGGNCDHLKLKNFNLIRQIALYNK